MGRVEVRGRRRLLDDFFKVDEAEVSFELADGSMTPPARRLVFERGDSVAAVVYHRDSDSLLFAEQFRYPTVGKGSGWVLEVVAGMIDSGESPETALRREIEEELGFAVTRCEPIATFFVSPGGSSERIWLYYAEVGEGGRVGSGGGLAAEQEEIRIVSLSTAAAMDALREGTLVDAKTIIGLQWLRARALS
ncbi:NUDIX hydrolase [Accumulibacter sp.]|uniref:NUDIX domain-containing protein n=1 Tax=Accumulibacter sp. TaxID=2053492 RepID=UPI0025FE493F|nr:NUDIX hydrolase [Accumulibacter sp.]MCM8612000.1 NUDIX hydrolase [Accumulibacter sp.]MCM8635969.1 NUDIX hydrolase [Accumulibacter sp.]MCM8641844.1 NUDIX hydrolase [Accumulibacter sp.]